MLNAFYGSWIAQKKDFFRSLLRLRKYIIYYPKALLMAEWSVVG
jgi:hypothetical protein